MSESRVKKSLLNAKVNLIFYVLTLSLSFFSRKIFLDCLGADFVGLTGTLMNLLGFLNLAELGVGATIGYFLYKPLSEKDTRKLCEIVSLLAYVYKWIGMIILLAGVMLSCFLPLIFSNAGFDCGVLYAVFYGFLISSLLGYFVNYKQIILEADQKAYIVVLGFQITSIIKVICQIWCVWNVRNYYLWIAVEVLFAIIYSIILSKLTRRIYPWLKTDLTNGKRFLAENQDVIKKCKQIFIHRIGSFVQWETTPFLTYTFASLNVVALYSNYALLVDRGVSLFSRALDSMQASVGSLVAESNESKVLSVFKELFYLRCLLAANIAYIFYVSADVFIKVWLGEAYVMAGMVVFLLSLRIWMTIVFGVISQFCFAFGLFWDVWAPAVSMVVFLATALPCGYLWGVEGVIFGTVLSYLVVFGIWKSILVFHWGFRRSPYIFLKMLLYVVAIMVLSVVVSRFACGIFSANVGLLQYSEILEVGIGILVYGVVSMCLFFVFVPEINQSLRRLTRR